MPDFVHPLPPFPTAGSVIGSKSQFFCLGRLGRGTFCSIHKCIDLSSGHSSSPPHSFDPRYRLVAAKVELTEFTNSGVLDGEAMILKHLSRTMPRGSVPQFIEHVKENSGRNSVSAIIMEYLPGEDMHLLRDKYCNSFGGLRRVSVEDAIYLTADCMLPLLKAMHEVGVIHRDVKPSNIVREGTTSDNRRFKLVDFGLSKSFVVPKMSPLADPSKPWAGEWCTPENEERSEGCIRHERPKADFRGTSMYASLRVHQLKDYGPRDDIWSLMYVFCDLVSGGLPWMKQASQRDREACRRIKEKVHGDINGTLGETDCLEDMLKGAEYHYGRGSEGLEMAKDANKVNLLRTAFQHLGSLGFSDKVDYDLIERCLKGFIEGENDADIPKINWDIIKNDGNGNSKKKKKKKRTRRGSHDSYTFGSDVEEEEDTKKLDSMQIEKPFYAEYTIPDLIDPVSSSILEEAEQEHQSSLNASKDDKNDTPQPPKNNTETGRYHVAIQMRLAQAEYNARNASSIPKHIALRDWMSLATLLARNKWEVSRYERGKDRQDDDQYRCVEFVKVVNRCLAAAKPFDNFRKREYFYGYGSEEKKPSLLTVSMTFHDLSAKIEIEEDKKCAPPPSISFTG